MAKVTSYIFTVNFLLKYPEKSNLGTSIKLSWASFEPDASRLKDLCYVLNLLWLQIWSEIRLPLRKLHVLFSVNSAQYACMFWHLTVSSLPYSLLVAGNMLCCHSLYCWMKRVWKLEASPGDDHPRLQVRVDKWNKKFVFPHFDVTTFTRLTLRLTGRCINLNLYSN